MFKERNITIWKIIANKSLAYIFLLNIVNILFSIFIYKYMIFGINKAYIENNIGIENLKILIIGYNVVAFCSSFALKNIYDKNYFQVKSENKLKLLFHFTMMLFIGVMVITGYLTHGEAIRSILHYNRNDVFMDYFNSIQYGLNPYSKDVIYPPLVNVMYGFLGRFIIKDGLSTPMYRVNQLGAIIFLLFSMASYRCFYSSFKKFCKSVSSNCNVEVYFWEFMFSLPFLYLLERGNSLIIALGFLMYFCYLYNSDSVAKRRLAMICLAIAASIKITPCLFGLLYMRDRKYREGIECFIVGVLVFNLPFLLTDGNLFILYDNIQETTKLFQGSALDSEGIKRLVGYGCYVNIYNTFSMLERLFNYELSSIGKFLNIVLLIISIIIIVLKKKLKIWKVYLLLCGIIVLTPGFSAVYNLTYYIIPLIIFLESNPKCNILNTLYLILFLGIFIPIINVKIPIFDIMTGGDIYPVRLSTFVESFSALFLYVLVLTDIMIFERKRSVKL